MDGEFRGETPLEITVAPQREHALRLTKAGHEAAEATVTLDLDEERALSLVLPARMGDVEVTAEPADAEVVVDGEVKGRAGQTLKLTATAHEIEVRRSGYAPHKVTVTPRPGLPPGGEGPPAQPAGAEGRPDPSRLSVRGHELRLLAPGRFQMGASRREPGRRANETLREVELRRPSYLSVREVTNAQFRRFLAAHSSGRFGNHDLDADAQPVVRVTWEQAAEYCNWLSAQEGLPPVYAMRGGKLVATTPVGTGFRLPTEAEWSRAARYPEGGALKYPWGASLPVPARLRQLCGRIGAAGGVRRPPGLRRPLPGLQPGGQLPAQRAGLLRPGRQRRGVGPRRLLHSPRGRASGEGPRRSRRRRPARDPRLELPARHGHRAAPELPRLRDQAASGRGLPHRPLRGIGDDARDEPQA